jgi:CheY-like chemotaxis protein
MGNRILVIKDDEDNRQILRNLLVRAGHQMSDNATNTAGARFDACKTFLSTW